jgi:hypothetical protein
MMLVLRDLAILGLLALAFVVCLLLLVATRSRSRPPTDMSR